MLLFLAVEAFLVAANVADVHLSDPSIVFEWKPSGQSSRNANSQIKVLKKLYVRFHQTTPKAWNYQVKQKNLPVLSRY